MTNIPATVMTAGEVIASYHDLWRIEQSFRMSKSDLAARPIFHRTREAIEAHLTIVLTALAIARDLQTRSGASLKKIITTLQPLRPRHHQPRRPPSTLNPPSPTTHTTYSTRSQGTEEVQLRSGGGR